MIWQRPQLDKVENAYFTFFFCDCVPFSMILHNVLTILNTLAESFKKKSKQRKEIGKLDISQLVMRQQRLCNFCILVGKLYGFSWADYMNLFSIKDRWKLWGAINICCFGRNYLELHSLLFFFKKQQDKNNYLELLRCLLCFCYLKTFPVRKSWEMRQVLCCLAFSIQTENWCHHKTLFWRLWFHEWVHWGWNSEGGEKKKKKADHENSGIFSLSIIQTSFTSV